MNHAKIAAALHELADAFFLAAVEAVETATTVETAITGKKSKKTAPESLEKAQAPTQVQAAAAPTAEPVPAAPAVPAITKDQLNKLVLKVAAKSRDAAEAILNRFGAVNTVTLPEAKWQAVYDAFEEEIAKQDAAAVQVQQASLV